MKKPLNTALKGLAIQAMEKSYSPYSKCKVGALIKLTNGKEYKGCNVENASFGGTVCAERVAIWKAVSEEGPQIKVTEVYVATDASPPWFPCGLCRQVINEFATKDCAIHLTNLKGETLSFTHEELFPHGFDPSSLPTY